MAVMYAFEHVQVGLVDIDDLLGLENTSLKKHITMRVSFIGDGGIHGLAATK